MRKNQVILLESNHNKSFKEIFIRVLWYIFWSLMISWTPRIFNKWRIFLFKVFGAKIGKKVLILGNVWVDMPWNLTIGDFSAIGKRVWLYNFAKVDIGKNTVVSQDTTICTASHDYTNPYMPLYSQPIKIEDQVWIGAECFLMPGIKVAEGAVIGARSLVTKDMPSWMVCAGNPCKPLKERILNNK